MPDLHPLDAAMTVAAVVEPVSEALTWLTHLYEECTEGGWVTSFSIDRRDDRRITDWAELPDLSELATTAGQRAEHGCVWFGVATRRQRLGGGRRGGAEDCLQIPALWVDVDVEGPNHKGEHPLPPTIEAAYELLNNFPLSPTAVVRSGGGLQGWWLLTEPLDVAAAAELLPAWGATWAELARRRGWHIDNVFDVARIMRLPGTVNHKTTPTPVTAKACWSRIYNPSEFEPHLLDPPVPPEPTPMRIPYIGPERPGDAFNAVRIGGDILGRAGWALARRSSGEEHWTRPGKNPKEGTSATVYPDGHTTIWSDTVSAACPAVELRRPYDPFGLFTVLFHSGDFTAASDVLAAEGYGTKARATDDLSWIPEDVLRRSLGVPGWSSADSAPVDRSDARVGVEDVADPYQNLLARTLLNERARREARRILDAEEAAPPAIETTGPDPDIHQLFLEPEPDYRWLVPDLLERSDRVILTGPEGGGKSTLLRQLAVQAAAGISPFTLDYIDPLRVLYIDLENSRRHVLRKFASLVALVPGRIAAGYLVPIMRPDGVDLLDPAEVRWFTDRVEQNAPDIVVVGPLYKLATGDPKDEEIARRVAFLFDKLRATYDITVVIEAHQPHQQNGGRRPERPYGASLWMRWPEFGLSITRAGFLNHFRGARDERSWPTVLRRGGEWPWMTATAAQATFAALVGACQTEGRVLSERELVTATGIPKTTVHRAIEANRSQWDALESEFA